MAVKFKFEKARLEYLKSETKIVIGDEVILPISCYYQNEEIRNTLQSDLTRTLFYNVGR